MRKGRIYAYQQLEQSDCGVSGRVGVTPSRFVEDLFQNCEK